MNFKKIISLALFIFTLNAVVSSQSETSDFSYSGKPRTYEIGGIEVTGNLNNDPQILANLSGLKVGQQVTVPGEQISNAIKKYWEYGLFSDVKIGVSKIEGRLIFLEIYLQERPRLSELNYHGLKKSEREAVDEKVSMMKGSQVTPYLVARAERFIKGHFVEKGFYNIDVDVVQRDDTSKVNHVILDVYVDKKDKVKVKTLTFEGNEAFTDAKLNRITKKTNEKGRLVNFFRTKKFVREDYNEDLDRIIEKYNEKGYRDAYIAKDSVSRNEDNTVDVFIKIDEGNKYYFGDISWVGNSMYPGEYLSYILRINKGDVFNQTLLDKRLYIEDDAVHNLYMNDGYLFSRITPVDARIANDTVDIEMRIYEGDQATINNIVIRGNTKTHEHVVRRELRTKPGDLFDKSALMRTVRELAQLGHFDPEKLSPVPIPNPEKGNVDIEFDLEEKANDQVELSGGWGGGMFIGSLGLKFSNFSMRNFLNKEAWRPLPSGDGQTLSLRAQTNGKYYQSYSMTFVEPWLGGSKPNSLSVSIFRSIQSGVSDSYYNNIYNYGYGYGYGSSYGSGVISKDYVNEDEYIKNFGVSVGFGKRLTWPDDFFSLYTEASYVNYDSKNWRYNYYVTDGLSHILKARILISRNSIDNPLYTRSGSSFSVGLEATPPYSLLSGKDYSKITDTNELYKFIEYHKWSFKGSIFKPIDRSNKLVIMSKFEAGFLGYYNEYVRSPYEKYQLGGDGMTGYSYLGTETVGLRGYQNQSVTAMSILYNDEGKAVSSTMDANLYTKMTMELRYPLTLQPSATVYGLIFAEAGNSWTDFKDYNPFNLKRSAGVGVRIFLPMFGLLGLDWGYGFDEIPYNSGASGSNFHFTMGQNF